MRLNATPLLLASLLLPACATVPDTPARQGTVQSAGSPGGVPGPSPVGSPVSREPILAPVWKVGDEWQYAYKTQSASGTFVVSVNRIEVLDGVQYYVVKSGQRETFYRASDLAIGFDRVNGVVVLRQVPPRLLYAWPLTVGRNWEQSYREERPVDRQTTDHNSVWAVEAEETVTVPAGTFRTLKIVQRNRNTGALTYEMWYAGDAKQWVKIREMLSDGVRERELIAYKFATRTTD